MKVVVVQTGSNFASVEFVLQKLKVDYEISNDKNAIVQADKVILPGVSHAGVVMRNLQNKGLVDCIQNLKTPVLGICLGMQILFDYSEESLDQTKVPCLGVLKGAVKKIPASLKLKNSYLKVPHMGWNELIIKQNHPLLEKVGGYVYFVHSFFADCDDSLTLASADYGIKIPAIVAKNNFFGCQFHPEKSSQVGEQLLRNFINL